MPPAGAAAKTLASGLAAAASTQQDTARNSLP